MTRGKRDSWRKAELEIRNSKQIQMTQIGKIPNKLALDSLFRIFPIWDLFVFEFVSDLDIRISDFAMLASWRGERS